MRITRRFTTAGQDPFSTVRWTTRSSKITNPDGTVVFSMEDAEVPETWSQLATDIMVSKYFRRAGVPQDGGPHGLPTPGYAGPKGATAPTGGEKSARQVIHRLVGCWRHWGEAHGYFDTAADAEAFYDELAYMLVHQVAAPNSPQWFNTGLAWAYGISGPAQGHWIADPQTGQPRLAEDAYSHPQPHACFIQSVEDDLVNPGGIMDLWVREARLFKYGSGTGTNFSKLRGENERLSGGGRSSGLMSWLKIGDRAAGAIKSGGTTRRAAKMVCLDMDHPDIEQFINWKVREEIKVAALVEGMRVLKAKNEEVRQTAERLGLNLDYDFNGEAYATVAGQNSNNSVRIPDGFFEALDAGGQWQTRHRVSGKPAKALGAGALWDDIAYAAWRCADPGVQYDTTINAWHTCPGGGRINASNPCSEYMFLDNTACNLASINLIRLYDPAGRRFDVDRYEHATDLWTMVLEISVLMAAFPSREIAELSWRYRTLGLGYANLGAMLMQAGVAYDSEAARALAGVLTAVLCGRAYRMSALLAKEHGAFAGYAADRQNMLRVIANHRAAAHGAARDSAAYRGLAIRPVPIDHAVAQDAAAVRVSNAPELLGRATRAWDEALELGGEHGFRNAQVTVIAPTGTIGLLMDCDTTGVEPDFALVKFKKLAGGGYFKIANASVRPALEALGYSPEEIRGIMVYLLGALDLNVPVPGLSDPGPGKGSAKEITLRELLLARGLSEGDLRTISESLPGVFELSFAFTAWGLGDDALRRAGVDPAAAKADPAFNLLAHVGLSRAQVDRLNDVICGRQTVEGAPRLRGEHLSVFDCANTCGKYGTRSIAPEGHIRMMAAVQPFISGAISKTINLPREASVDDCKRAYRLSWELGLKANALYRDGSKFSQPLSTSSEGGGAGADKPAAEDAPKKAGSSSGTTGALSLEAKPALSAPAAGAAIEPAGGGGGGGAGGGGRARPMRRRLPDTRASITHKFNVAGHEGYLTVGLYEDGMPGELFITMAKEGSTIGGLMDAIGTSTSVSLQYGVPVESLVNKFTHQRFEPAGMTTNPDIPFAKSLVDYIFRWMGMQFIPGYREANAPQRGPAGGIVSQEYDLAHRLAEAAGRGPEGAPGPSGTEPLARRLLSEHAEPPLPFVPGDPHAQGHNGDSHAHAHVHRTMTQTRLEIDVDVDVEAPGRAGVETVLARAMRAAGDGPPCSVCGTITVRNGACYKCVNCGTSQGCS
ncbi:MAG: ribonucleoside-diphosphate reductase, adenosylcobalamin-dependent [Planctomyces sp.]|nr:ribonucleoside-diphosphate reductase, adenosylcobalamin-dependent [Planctomyces sp.]